MLISQNRCKDTIKFLITQDFYKKSMQKLAYMQ